MCYHSDTLLSFLVQGTVMGFAGFTANKTLAGLVKAFFAYAPVTTTQYIKGAFKLLSDYYQWVEVRCVHTSTKY